MRGCPDYAGQEKFCPEIYISRNYQRITSIFSEDIYEHSVD